MLDRAHVMSETYTRLRRALHLRSLSLVRRIIESNPQLQPELVRNADLQDKGETSLHLAASLGLPDVAKFLLANGHEDAGISRTTDGTTPLMLAAAAGADEADAITAARIAVGRLLVEHSPQTTAIKDHEGKDAFAHACRHGTIPLISLLLSLDPPAELLVDPEAQAGQRIPHAFLDTRDNARNAPLHHASAFGHLKTLRLLIDAGADPAARNTFNWTALDYSATVSAEVYFRGLVREREQRLQLEAGVARGNVNITRARGASDLQRIARPGVRLVRSEGSATSDDESDNVDSSNHINEREAAAYVRARAET